MSKNKNIDEIIDLQFFFSTRNTGRGCLEIRTFAPILHGIEWSSSSITGTEICFKPIETKSEVDKKNWQIVSIKVYLKFYCSHLNQKPNDFFSALRTLNGSNKEINTSTYTLHPFGKLLFSRLPTMI